MKLIGMILWLARCTRPDISYAVSRLGSRVSKWDDIADEQLAICIGYLRKHTAKGIVMMVHKQEDHSSALAKVFVDADLPSKVNPKGGVRHSRDISWLSRESRGVSCLYLGLAKDNPLSQRAQDVLKPSPHIWG